MTATDTHRNNMGYITPPYPHYAHLPYAREPWKSLYVLQRLLTTLALVPFWAIYYLVLPRSHRPRPSWSIRQIIYVKFTRRINKITHVAGVTWGTRPPDFEPRPNSLKETRFEWVESLPEKLRSGIVVGVVPFKRVGCYIWPKTVPPVVQVTTNISANEGNYTILGSNSSVDIEVTAADTDLVGMFMHGGGYCHMSAHESSNTSRIPRRLMKDKIFKEIYTVEYRLLQYAPFPATIQDAAAVYAHIVREYETRGSKCKIVLIGDSSGGNLVLALTRWLRDEGKLPMPHALLLLSPSCDASHAFPDTLSSYIPRPNASTDFLLDTPEPNVLLQRTFLGFASSPQPDLEEEERLMEILHSEYVSPCSPRVLKRWGHDVRQDMEGRHEEAFRRESLIMEGVREMEAKAIVKRASLDLGVGTAEFLSNVNRTGSLEVSSGVSSNITEVEEVREGAKRSKFRGLFEGFPKTLIVVGDAERLVREVKSLQGAMEKDGVDVQAEWMKDTVHDVLMMNQWWWDWGAVEETWGVVGDWAAGLRG